MRTPRALARSAVLVASVTAASSCQREALPSGQLIVFIDTDAPLLRVGSRAPSPLAPIALFDRVLIEVHAPGEPRPCSGCSREFEIDESMVVEGRASIGVLLPPGRPGYRARVRMFLASSAIGGMLSTSRSAT